MYEQIRTLSEARAKLDWAYIHTEDSHVEQYLEEVENLLARLDGLIRDEAVK